MITMEGRVESAMVVDEEIGDLLDDMHDNLKSTCREQGRLRRKSVKLGACRALLQGLAMIVLYPVGRAWQ